MGLPLSITVDDMPDGLELRVAGELDLACAPSFLAAVAGAINTDAPQVDIDLAGLWFMDSSGIHALVRAQGLAREHISSEGVGCHLRILRPSRPAQIALLAAGVDGYLEIADDLAGAPVDP